MLPDDVHAGHLVQLGFIKEILEEAELPTNLLERSVAIPFHVLMAGFQEDRLGRDRFLHFSFLPLNDEDMQSVQLLQIYSTLPFPLKLENKEAVALLLLEVNTQLPIGHFGINEHGEIHYRYVHSLSVASTIDADAILDIVSLFVYMCDMFSEPVEHAASGISALE
jgi:hypothetical protein